MKPSTGGVLPVRIVLVGLMLAAAVSCQPVQCDDSDANAEETYGKLQVIPPASDEPVPDPVEGLADDPLKLTPSKTQHDILKSHNSKFLGVERSSEEQ